MKKIKTPVKVNFQEIFEKITNDYNSSVLLNFLYFHAKKISESTFHVLQTEILRSTLVSKQDHANARLKLEGMGILKTELIGLPPKNFYTLDLDALSNILEKAINNLSGVFKKNYVLLNFSIKKTAKEINTFLAKKEYEEKIISSEVEVFESRKVSDSLTVSICTYNDGASDIIYVGGNKSASIEEVNYIMNACADYLSKMNNKKIDALNFSRDKKDREFIRNKAKEERDAPRPSISKNGFVYLMKNLRNNFYKIGFTAKNPKFREATLQSQEPEVKLINFFQATMHDEMKLHVIFSAQRIRGEWFELSVDDLLKIEQYFASKEVAA